MLSRSGGRLPALRGCVTGKESRLWLELIRYLRCAHCKRGGTTDAHHVWNAGMSRKCSDAAVIPLCRSCHSSHHSRAKPDRDWCAGVLRRFWERAGVKVAVRPGTGERRRREMEQAAWEKEAAKMLKRVGTRTYLLADEIWEMWGE